MATAARPRNQQDVRRRNLAAVLHVVADAGPLSRASVAARIGLTRAAVSTLVDELLTTGLLVEQGPGRSGAVGRPGTDLALNDRGPCGIGAEIGVDRLQVCAVDLRGAVRARAVVAADSRDSEPGPVLARLAGLVAQVAAEAREAGLEPAGVCVAVPGLVARDRVTVVRAPNLGWRDVDLARHLPREAGSPLCADNEANLGALAELWLGGHDPEPRDALHVSAAIGIGAAILVEGELLRGARGFAGELGHVPVQPEGRPCGCGSRGCLEQYAGEEAVLRAAGPATTDRDARPGSDGPGSEGPGARTAALAARAASGEQPVRLALASAGTALGVALSGAVNLLDPATVVLGGGLAQLAPWLLPATEAELARRLPHPPALAVSRLGSDGPLLGAAHSVVRTVLDHPPGRPG
ncbi:ROK family transcriptional regulator [Streptomyces sp. 549]|uniref:ROK family transcriptional regulator n=1 Tax=Streptomyces sp. 549 TaxID=3049076 RepID=UPI0024C416C9|nr:ROK family transcriptional regulator [Streptomyces sp. 549]MDK1474634.1 ROK family transcriptional regulator [Streptomyces sp. 549]